MKKKILFVIRGVNFKRLKWTNKCDHPHEQYYPLFPGQRHGQYNKRWTKQMGNQNWNVTRISLLASNRSATQHATAPAWMCTVSNRKFVVFLWEVKNHSYTFPEMLSKCPAIAQNWWRHFKMCWRQLKNGVIQKNNLIEQTRPAPPLGNTCVDWKGALYAPRRPEEPQQSQAPQGQTMPSCDGTWRLFSNFSMTSTTNCWRQHPPTLHQLAAFPKAESTSNYHCPIICRLS